MAAMAVVMAMLLGEAAPARAALDPGLASRLRRVETSFRNGDAASLRPAFTGNGKVRVDLSIAKQFSNRVRKNSVARIETQGLLGDRIIELTVGTADAPATHDGDVIVAVDPTDFGKIVNQGAETVKNVAALAESLRSTAETLKQSYAFHFGVP